MEVNERSRKGHVHILTDGNEKLKNISAENLRVFNPFRLIKINLYAVFDGRSMSLLLPRFLQLLIMIVRDTSCSNFLVYSHLALSPD